MLIKNDEGSTSKNYKPYLKQLIEEHLPNTKFVKNKNANMPEQSCSTVTQDYLFNTSMTECANDNLAKIFTVAKLVREEVLSKDRWKFQDTFSDFILPPLLSALIRWILIGPTDMIEESKRKSCIDRGTSVVTQVVM